MEHTHPDSVKHREIGFRDPHPDSQQAQTALLLLGDVDGVLRAWIPDPARNSLHVEYDLERVCLSSLEGLLTERGLHIDNSLLAKLRRALYYYTEENERQASLVHDDQDHSTREIFLHRYRSRTHGCRDDRPSHWRNYL
jgi:hypothetical protein